MTTPFVVGAYAILPPERAEHGSFYAALPAWVTGLEIPWKLEVGMDPDPAWFAAQVARFTDSVLTLIPATMVSIGSDPWFGLASPDADGRAAALAMAREALDAVERLHEDAGAAVVRWVHVHSGPSDRAESGPFERSLGELADDFARVGVRPVIEHCDAAAGVGPGEKRFLTLADEAAVASEVGAAVTLNWGRSVLESHDPGAPRAQVAELVAAGLLGGLMFSGAGGEATQYGGPWADAHLPLSTDEPASLMTPAHVAACVAAAGGAELYRGAKVQAPASASVAERVGMLGRIRAAMV